ncbi:MAG: hypothetical protein IJW08_06360 [Lentisphaeria bacterium]|nr:hypothetical protein [Lentisphaeria bacterium]
MPFTAVFDEKFCRESAPSDCTIIIFGSSGNLAEKKIFPALDALEKRGLLHPSSRIAALSRRKFKLEELLAKIRVSPALARKISVLQFDPDDPDSAERLDEHLRKIEPSNGKNGRIFYFAVPTVFSGSIIKLLHRAGLLNEPSKTAFRNVALEKPLGENKADINRMYRFLSTLLEPHQIYLVDHYLGKDDVQNILMLRFANRIFSGIWNNSCIEKLTIGVSERHGIGSRGAYFDRTGIIRDMFQSHLLLMLGLCIMARPDEFDVEHIHRNLNSAIESIRVEKVRFAGQYEGYLQEQNVAANSGTLTCADICCRSTFPGWHGVKMRLFAGKAMAQERTVIRASFRGEKLPFADIPDAVLPGNELELELKPDSGIKLQICCKKNGPLLCLGTLSLSHTAGKQISGDGYWRILLACQNCDRTFFPDIRMLENAGAVCDEAEKMLSPESVRIYSRGTLDFSA